MRSEEVRQKLRWLAKSQTAIRQDCSDSASGGRCDYCQNPISVGEMECVITGRFRGHHAFLIWQLLAHLDYLDEAIGILSGQVETVIAPFADALTRLDSIPGINQRTAEVIIAEIGVDMSAFPSAGHLASWAALCPGNNESAGKHKSGKMRKGNRWLRTALIEAAAGASRGKNSALQARFRPVLRHRGPKKAVVAVPPALFRAAHPVLAGYAGYRELGGGYYDPQQSQRGMRRAPLEGQGAPRRSELAP